MIKIGFVIDTIETPAAGTEKQLLMLLNGLDRTRFFPYLICLRDSDWLKTQRFEFPVVIYDLKKILSFGLLKYLRQFAHLIRQEKLDIIQTFFVDANMFGTLGARLARCKIIISSRRNIGDWHTRLHVSILRLLRRWTTQYLANSEAAAIKTVKAERVPRSKITVIYNGLDHRPYRSLSPDMRWQRRRQWNIADNETLIGSVANLRDVKNIDSFIRAAACLNREFPTLKYVVVGDGANREKLKNLIDSLSLTDKFHLVGRYMDIVPCLAAFDIAVTCSSFESFSNSLIEYMAAGLPIVASDVGGNSEAVSHDENGLLYPADNEKELANGLRRLLSDRPLAARLGQSAKKSAFDRFSREAYIRSHEEYYTNLVKAHIT
jgi:glycosyltransferase involved in cell wall biosynthesis